MDRYALRQLGGHVDGSDGVDEEEVPTSEVGTTSERSRPIARHVSNGQPATCQMVIEHARNGLTLRTSSALAKWEVAPPSHVEIRLRSSLTHTMVLM